MLWLAYRIAQCVRKDRSTFLRNNINSGREVAGLNAIKQKRRDLVLAFSRNGVMLTQSGDALK